MFGRDRVHVILYEDLVSDPEAALSEVFAALGVSWQQVDLPRSNASGLPRSVRMQKFLSGDNRAKQLLRRFVPRLLWLRVRAYVQHKNLERAPMTQEDRAALVQDYLEDVEQLETLLGRDLAAWKA